MSHAKADDANMDPKLRKKRLRMIKKVIDGIPSKRIPELENFVLGLMPQVGEESTTKLVLEAVRLIEESKKATKGVR